MVGGILTAAMFFVFLLVIDVARYQAQKARALSHAQMSVLGSLRMRREALKRVAERWSALGIASAAVDSNGRTFVPSAKKASLVSGARTLSRALSGYQARSKSIVTVLAQAHRIERDSVVVVDDRGALLDIAPQDGVVVNEAGATQAVPALWYRRGWEPAIEHADPAAEVVHRVEFSVVPLGFGVDRWSGSVTATGRLLWNMSAGGNGGYPRNWSSAVDSGRLNPNRTAAYRAVLTDVP